MAAGQLVRDRARRIGALLLVLTLAAGALVVATSAPAAADPSVSSADWTQHGIAPSPRREHAMVYDDARNQTVMFGGNTEAAGRGYSAETWLWDGSSWTRPASSTGPGARTRPAMAYDSIRQRVLLFGGRSNSFGVVADTWEWDGATWTQLAPAVSPPGRQGHAMAFDAARGQVVLFGGLNNTTLLNDMWVWDGTTWTEVTEPRPSARYGHTLTFDPVRAETVLFGGRSSSSDLADTWAWNGTSWSERTPATAPPARAGHGMAYDAERQEIVLFGGGFSTYRNDVWTWDGLVWAQLATTNPPSGRRDLAMVYDVDRQRIVVDAGGGSDAGLFHNLFDTWELDDTVWTAVATATSPSTRQRPVLAYDSNRDRVVLYGEGSWNDTWEWSGTSWSVRYTSPSPGRRVEHAMVYDAARARTVLFGGASTADTWEWNGTSWSQKSTVTAPPARNGHAMVYDSDRDRVVLFGGSAYSGGLLDDTWEWDGSTWTQLTPATSPSPRRNHAMAYDAARQRVVLFGGGSGTATTETWEFDGTTWTQILTTTAPEGFGAMAYDSTRERPVYVDFKFDVAASAWRSRTWEWDGATWWQSQAAGPSARWFPGLTYADARQEIVLFGGEEINSDDVRDTWTRGRGEVCNGTDDDGDGEIDEYATTTYFSDTDGDSFGDPDAASEACALPDGHVENDDDCDDGDPSVRPNGTEVADDGVDQNCNDADLTTYWRDGDGDTYGDAGSTQTSETGAPSGYVANSADCDDLNAAVHPAATDWPDDGFDQNCSGADRRTYYRDADADTYGSWWTTQTSETGAPAGYVADTTDCDDTDSSIHPGAEEIADDGIDQNCNWWDLRTWYADADGDTYGDAGSSQTSDAGAPSGHVADSTDCDDTEVTTHPGAEEVADDGVDQDCDGADLVTWYADADGDGYGDAGSSQTSETGAPLGYVADSGDADDSDTTIHPNAAELCDGKDNDQDGAVDEPDVTECSQDEDGDGIEDGQDPDVVGDAVSDLPTSSFSGRGQQTAFLDRLDGAEALIASGDEEAAIDELELLLKKVDGCNGTPRERADKNDWITRCVDQRAVRDLLEELIANLESATATSSTYTATRVRY